MGYIQGVYVYFLISRQLSDVCGKTNDCPHCPSTNWVRYCQMYCHLLNTSILFFFLFIFLFIVLLYYSSKHQLLVFCCPIHLLELYYHLEIWPRHALPWNQSLLTWFLKEMIVAKIRKTTFKKMNYTMDWHRYTICRFMIWYVAYCFCY